MNNIKLKIIFIGNSGTGKTSIITRYIYNKFNNYNNTTIGCSFYSKLISLYYNSSDNNYDIIKK